MLVENQEIEVFWSNKIKAYYISKGYEYTKRNASFLVRAEDLNPSCTKKVRIICDECGSEFNSPYNSYYERFSNHRKDLCKSCTATSVHNRSKEDRAKKYFDKIKEVCRLNDYELITNESEFEGVHMDIWFKCPKHGVQSMMLDNFIRGHKCYSCSYESRANRCRNTPDYVEQVVNSYNGNQLLNKHEYVSSKTRNLRVLCGKCKKNTFLVSFCDYYNVNVHQCRSCSSKESVGEKLIADYLNKFSIEYVREKKFENCKDKRQLPFDFYVPKYNLIIEFDGQHHYFDVWGKEHFERTQRHDDIKNKFCEDNDIHLLRIPYWDGRNVDKLIGDKINDILYR